MNRMTMPDNKRCDYRHGAISMPAVMDKLREIGHGIVATRRPFKSDDTEFLAGRVRRSWQAKPIPDQLAVQTFFYESTAPPNPTELALLAASGVKFIRHDFNWVTAEQEPGVYDWTYHDQLVEQIESVGIRLFSTIANEENGGRNGHEMGVRQQAYGLHGCNGGCNTFTPTSVAAYARFAAAVVKRYAGKGFLWQLDDEPLMFWVRSALYLCVSREPCC
jgi:hypothetical protein